MPVSDLATEIVRIVTVGVQEAMAGIDSVRAGLGAMGGAAVKAAALTATVGAGVMGALRGPSNFFYQMFSSLRTLSRELTGIAQIANRLAFGGGLGLGGIITGAARGTVEGQRFADAMLYLTRVLGDGFAPYVRAVTAGLTELSQWFRTLSSDTRESIAQWSLITAGTLAFVGTLPMIVRGVGSVAAILGLLTSPAVLVVAAFAAITVAAARMFGFFESGSADSADAIQKSNETWLGSLVRGIGAAVTGIAAFFNFILEQGAKVSDYIGRLIAKYGEMAGLLPEGTLKTFNELPPIVAPKIDVAGVEAFFGKVQRGAAGAEADFSDLIAKLQQGGGAFQKIMNQANFGQGFHIKMNVEFESLQGTFERLQKALSSQPGQDIDKQQLGQLQQINDGIQKVGVGVAKIGDLVPAVR